MCQKKHIQLNQETIGTEILLDEAMLQEQKHNYGLCS